MAAITICSDFGAPKNKVSHCFHCFPIYLPWSDGTRYHDLSLLQDRLRETESSLRKELKGTKKKPGRNTCCIPQRAWSWIPKECSKLPKYLSFREPLVEGPPAWRSPTTCFEAIPSWDPSPECCSLATWLALCGQEQNRASLVSSCDKVLSQEAQFPGR